MSYFEGITHNTVAMTVLGRSLPIFIFLVISNPAFVVFLEFFLEYVDGVNALCVDQVSNVVYDRFDKLFDGISIILFSAYMAIRWRNATGPFGTPQAREKSYWVPYVLALAIYRLIGIAIFLISSQNQVFVFFANVWLPLFAFFTVMELWGVSLALFRYYKPFLFCIVALLFIYKFIEESLHHGKQGQDYIELSCGQFSTTFTHRDVFEFGRMIFPSFIILILIAIRRCCIEIRIEEGSRTKNKITRL